MNIHIPRLFRSDGKKDLRWLLTVPVAHRGYHAAGVPENSTAAFREALRRGWNAEMDVHRMKDDVLMVFHDDSLLRMAGTDRMIHDCMYDEIRNLSLAGTGERIPVLPDLLGEIRGRAGVFIEVKTHPDIGRTEELLARILDAYEGNFAVLSFDPRILRWFYRNRPHYIRGQISGGLKGKDLPFLRRFLVRNLVVCPWSRPDIIAYEERYFSPWIRFAAGILRVPVILWTIRDPETAGKVLESGRNIIFEEFDVDEVRCGRKI